MAPFTSPGGDMNESGRTARAEHAGLRADRLARFVSSHPGLLYGTSFAVGAALETAPNGRVPSGAAVLVLAVTVGAIGVCARSRFPSPRVRQRLARTVAIGMVFAFAGAGRVHFPGDSSRPSPPRASAIVRGVVVSPPLTDAPGGKSGLPATSFDLRTESIGAPVHVRSLQSIPGVRGGDLVSVQGTVLPGRRGSVQLRADRRASVRLLREPGSDEGSEPTRTGTRLRVAAYRALGSLRQHLYDRLGQLYCGDDHGVLLALLLGDRRALSASTRDALVDSGTFHFLAISGLHVGLVLWAIRRIPCPRRARLTVRLGLAAAFVILTGGQPPAVRAGIFLAAQLVYASRDRWSPPLNALGWTALLLLGFDPLLVRDVGFLLSFVAVLAILTWGQRLAAAEPSAELPVERRPSSTACRVVAGATSVLRRAFAASLAATVATTPVLLWTFGRIHPLAPLWNVIAFPFVAAGLFAGAGSLVVSSVSVEAARPLAAVAAASLRVLTSTLEFAAGVPGSSLQLGGASFVAIGAVYFVLVAGIATPARSRTLAAALVLVAAAVFLGPRPGAALHVVPGTTRGSAVVRVADAATLIVEPRPDTADGIARALAGLPRARVQVVGLTSLDSRVLDRVSATRHQTSERSVRPLWRGEELRARPTASFLVLQPSREDPASRRRLVARVETPTSSCILVGAGPDRAVGRLLSGNDDLRADLLVVLGTIRRSEVWSELLRRVEPRRVVVARRDLREEIGSGLSSILRVDMANPDTCVLP